MADVPIAADLDALLTALIRREGDFAHLPADRGGATRWGITQTTLAAWRGQAVTVADVQALTQAEAKTIYTALFFDRPGISRLPAQFHAFLLDTAVNSGPAVAIRLYQEALGLTPDGVCGPRTIAAMTIGTQTRPVLQRMVIARCGVIGRICQRDPSQSTFLPGWLSRVLSFLPEA